MRLPFAAALVLVSSAGLALADEAEDIAKGKELAQRWCSDCHVIGPETAGGDAGPTFESVARRPGTTEEGVLRWLAEPHPPMPDLHLTAADAEVLSAYIFSLSK